METALKMARQYHLERGAPSRTHVISRRLSYHGNTLGALGVSGHVSRRAPYEPLSHDELAIDPCFAYRYAQVGETRGLCAVARRMLWRPRSEAGGRARHGLHRARRSSARPAGAVPPAPGYLTRIREICDRHGVLLILDEVMCGAGRTGSFLACEQDGVVPDLVTLAKGLAGGYQPIGAVLCSDEVYGTFARGSGAFVNGHTYSAHPIACAAALAVQEVIREQDLLAHVRSQGIELRARLAERFGAHPFVGDVRGRGLLMALELVANRDTREPFDVAEQLAARVKAQRSSVGSWSTPGSGTIDGRRGDHILLAPPYTVLSTELEVIVDRLGQAIDAATADKKPS